jgi:hypothetical protein
VIGNPPYVSVTNIDEIERPYYLTAFDTAEGRFDAYVLFLERGLGLLALGGRISYINPVKFCIYANGKRLREMLLRSFELESLLDISQCADVFEEPSTYPCMLVARNRKPNSTALLRIAKARSSSAESFINALKCGQESWEALAVANIVKRPESIISPSVTAEIWVLLERRESISQPIGKFYDIEQCIRIGSPKVRQKLVIKREQVVGLPTREQSRCFPLLDGENLQRYEILWDGIYLCYQPKELYNPKSTELLNRKKILIKRVAERTIWATTRRARNTRLSRPYGMCCERTPVA